MVIFGIVIMEKIMKLFRCVLEIIATPLAVILIAVIISFVVFSGKVSRWAIFNKFKFDYDF